MDYLLILLKANMVLSLFYGTHYLWLRKLTFYNLNRFYLLLAFVMASLFPFLDFTWDAVPAVQLFTATISFTDLAQLLQKKPQVSGITWSSIIMGIYASGMLSMILIFLIRLSSLLLLYFKSEAGRLQGQQVRYLKTASAPFSFFHIIFIRKDFSSVDNHNMILEHEKVHVQQYHSVDVLVAALFKMLNWFNPLAWLMEKAIRENLEYIADHKVLELGFDATTYQYNLLAVTQVVPPVSLANNYNFAHLKNRIIMMNKPKSPRAHVTKYLLALPFVAAFSLLAQQSDAQVRKVPVHKPVTKNKASGTQKQEGKTIYLLDGKEVKEQDIQSMNSDDIESVNVFKNQEEISKYPQYKNAEGIIAIVTKKKAAKP